eukprot:TRINITY_DN48226_c0_g1_i1.p1 TRINITY_DN48226_c0_g1~~TRINITY_DN48226_c0_g1_i1.p1  ORF type:complete len:524 (+),score=106.32 TRINITY_DN48226_c0_g1_i1:96-1667(+)
MRSEVGRRADGSIIFPPRQPNPALHLYEHDGIRFSRVVEKVDHRGGLQPRVVVVTTRNEKAGLVLCALSSDVKRFAGFDEIASVRVQESRTGIWQALVKFNPDAQEPDVLLMFTAHKLNLPAETPAEEVANFARACAAASLYVSGREVPVIWGQGLVDLSASPGRLKPSGYVQPRSKFESLLAVQAQQSSQRRERIPTPPPMVHAPAQETPRTLPPPPPPPPLESGQQFVRRALRIELRPDEPVGIDYGRMKDSVGGVWVAHVTRGSAASAAGLHAGSRITVADRRPVNAPEDLIGAVSVAREAGRGWVDVEVCEAVDREWNWISCRSVQPSRLRRSSTATEAAGSPAAADLQLHRTHSAVAHQQPAAAPPPATHADFNLSVTARPAPSQKSLPGASERSAAGQGSLPTPDPLFTAAPVQAAAVRGSLPTPDPFTAAPLPAVQRDADVHSSLGSVFDGQRDMRAEAALCVDRYLKRVGARDGVQNDEALMLLAACALERRGQQQGGVLSELHSSLPEVPWQLQ